MKFLMMMTDKKKSRDEYGKISFLYNKWINSDLNSEHTRESYRTSLKLFFKYFLKEDKHIAMDSFSAQKALCKDMIEEWELWLLKRGNSNQTINLRRSNLMSFLEFIASEDLEYIHYYTEAKTIHHRKNTHKKQQALSLAATEAIINTPDIKTRTGLRDTVLMGMMYCTGARLGEILSVRIKDLTLPTKNDKTGSVLFHGKGNKYRCMPLDGNIIGQICLYIKRQHGNEPSPDSYLFYSPFKGKDGKLSARAIEKRIKVHTQQARKQCEEVPADMHSHLFRHTRATNWVKEKHRLPVVSKLLGHGQEIKSF